MHRACTHIGPEDYSLHGKRWQMPSIIRLLASERARGNTGATQSGRNMAVLLAGYEQVGYTQTAAETDESA